MKENCEVISTATKLDNIMVRKERTKPFRLEMLIHIWISPKHWKDASEEKRSLGSEILYVFLSLGTQVYKYICVIVDHWFFWVTG